MLFTQENAVLTVYNSDLFPNYSSEFFQMIKPFWDTIGEKVIYVSYFTHDPLIEERISFSSSIKAEDMVDELAIWVSLDEHNSTSADFEFTVGNEKIFSSSEESDHRNVSDSTGIMSDVFLESAVVFIHGDIDSWGVFFDAYHELVFVGFLESCIGRVDVPYRFIPLIDSLRFKSFDSIIKTFAVQRAIRGDPHFLKQFRRNYEPLFLQ